jgi:hypothetical protein
MATPLAAAPKKTATATAKADAKPAAAAVEAKPASAPAKPAGPRSPFPEPGETLDKPIPPTRLAADDAPPSKSEDKPAATGVIPWHEAHQHVGEKITVEGVIVLARNTGKVCFLNFSKDWQGKFYVIIFEDALNAWDQPPEKYFLNKKVHITGVVKERKGTPQIQVNQGSQIQVVDGKKSGGKEPS